MELPPPFLFARDHRLRFFSALLVIRNDLLSNVRAAPRAAVCSGVIRRLWGRQLSCPPALFRSLPGTSAPDTVPSASSPGHRDEVQLL